MPQNGAKWSKKNNANYTNNDTTNKRHNIMVRILDLHYRNDIWGTDIIDNYTVRCRTDGGDMLYVWPCCG